jgi:RNA polymerase sigma-70 factor (ECF subfamily)
MPAPTPTLLAHLFDSHAPALLLYARHFVDAARAEDLVQEVFLRLAAQPRTPENPRAWLLATLKNAALDTLKSDRRRKLRDAAAAAQRPPLFIAPPDDPLHPDDLHAALQRLPPLQREILTLRLWTGSTFPEIAALTGIAVSSAFAHYQAALVTLKTCLETPCEKNQR